ncbi:hypothetical protein B0H67DRAFT_639493 [Lasiosphaeris hirsuta]|uniref:AA1-like domain-containing protein n=1 Tax=Lasiosphaeris hirsuta TaxID=260670 RepID=A0AA40BBD7_9PEZI|nr:hypothetical protein B0H67DRAFT_639493 [Lasiosphaeris hirsuta]
MGCRTIVTFLALTLASGATAAAIPATLPPSRAKQNVTVIPSFNVSDFTASAIVLSHRDFYRFDVIFCKDHPPVHCEALGTTLSEELGSIPQTRCGDSSEVSFKWTRYQDGTSDLLIMREVVAAFTGEDRVITDEAVYTVPSNDTPRLGPGKLQHMVYAGPENFSVPALRFEVCRDETDD